MPWTKLPPSEVAQLRSVRVSDRIHDLICTEHGSLAAYIRKYEEISDKLALLAKLEQSHYDELLNQPDFTREKPVLGKVLTPYEAPSIKVTNGSVTEIKVTNRGGNHT